MADNKYTFLGAGDAALSMFIEIIASNHGKDFSIEIIENMAIDHKHKYMIPGIENEIIFHDKWRRSESDKILIGVNKPNSKQAVFKFFKEHHNIQLEDYSSLAHQQSSIASTATLGNGVLINPGVTIAPFASLGNLVTINRNVSVGHHTHLSDRCTIHPGANIAGHIQIGSGSTIGMGANVIDGITIGENSIIGAGSLVTKDIPANVMAYGFPAKVVKHLPE